MTNSFLTNFTDPDIHELLAKHRKVAVIGCIKDVQRVRPDLSDDQAWEVLRACKDHHFYELGFTGDFVGCFAEEMFLESYEESSTEKGE